jgi:hypothetical protein
VKLGSVRLRFVLALIAFLTLGAMLVLFAVFGLPPVIDPNAWQLRWKLDDLLHAEEIAIGDDSEWAGTDQFYAAIRLSRGRSFSLHDVKEQTVSARPQSIIVSAICGHRLSCNRPDSRRGAWTVLSGVDVLADNNRGLAWLGIRTVKDLDTQYERLCTATRQWAQGTTIQMKGVNWSCSARRPL